MRDVLATIDTLALRVGGDGQASIKSTREALANVDTRLSSASEAARWGATHGTSKI